MLRGGGPAYVIFHDAALREMAELRPVSPEKLLEVGGVGRMKLEKYGEEFFAVLKRWDAPAVE
ncbi:MAG: HRDC domain-containing protein [bacterium]